MCDELKALKLDIAELQIRIERKIGEILPPKAKRDTKRKKGVTGIAVPNNARHAANSETDFTTDDVTASPIDNY